MLKIAICDDDPAHAELLGKRLTACALEIPVKAQISLFESYEALQADLTETSEPSRYKLLVVKKTMGSLLAAPAVRSWREQGCTSEVLLFGEGELRPEDYEGTYLLATISAEDERKQMRDAFRFAALRYEKKPTIILYAGDGRRNGFVVDDIIYVEVYRTELQVHGEKGVAECTGALADVYEKLPKPQFYRAHRSFIVNLEKVRSMEKYRFTMKNGDFVAIAKNRYAEARKAWQSYLG